MNIIEPKDDVIHLKELVRSQQTEIQNMHKAVDGLLAERNMLESKYFWLPYFNKKKTVMGFVRFFFRRIKKFILVKIFKQKTVKLKDSPNIEERKRWKNELEFKVSGEVERLMKMKDAYKGKRAFIIGNGPSIKDQDLTLLKDEITFATNWFANHPQYDEIQPKFYCISSHELFGGWNVKEPEFNKDLLNLFETRRWKSHHIFSFDFRDYILGLKAFSRDLTNFMLFAKPKYQVDEREQIETDIAKNMDDGYTGIITFCLPLALHLGITEVYLIGCDCDYGLQKESDPKKYFYDFKLHTSKTSKYDTLQRVWSEGGPVFKSYEVVKKTFESKGMKIYNSTAGGKLEVFERVQYESLFLKQ